MLTIGTGAASLVGNIPERVSRLFFIVGGETVVLAWAALVLLGVARAAHNRRLSSAFLYCIVALAVCLLIIEGSGSLWWRFGASELWNNVPDSQGRLRQSSGLTCAPAAAAMLLHTHGIAASEGEMAYLAGTSLFGTDVRQTARALDLKVRPYGWHVSTQHTDYDMSVGRRKPFVAHIRGPYLGHAVLVTHVAIDHVQVLDPLEGIPKTVVRDHFAAIWDGTLVEVVESVK